MKRVLWVSRFAPFGVPAQIEALRGMFGHDCEVVHKDISNARQIANEFGRGGYADIVCVLPLAILDHLCREGVRPLWAEMSEAPIGDRSPDLDFRGKRYWFAGYKRVRGVRLELEPLQRRSDVRVVARFTRHRASEEELFAFNKYFGTVLRVREFPDVDASSAQAILAEARECGADEILVVAPYIVIDQLIKSGVRPLWGKMDRGRFVSLHRVVGVAVDLEEI